MSAPKTFRDFAAAIMTDDVAAAGRVLEELLGLDAARAAEAAAAFAARGKAEGPAFMGKAMGLRAAKASGSRDAMAALLADLFALAGDDLATATTTVASAP